MKLSVIIVSYNEEQYLKQSIESVLRQNISDMEIIIGDDGSNDNSLSIIEEYAGHQNISYFVMDRKKNDIFVPSYRVSNVFKRGFSLAKGDYIMCLSGDDYFEGTNCLERLIDILEQDKAKKYSACVSNYHKVWDNGDEENFQLFKFPNHIYWSGHYIHLSCIMFRRDVFEKQQLLDRFCDDTGLVYSMIKCGKWKYVDEVTLAYRQRDKSIMHEADMLELNILELLLYQDILNRNGNDRFSMARFARPLKYVYQNREQLTNEKYKKYIVDASHYENNIVDKIQHYERFTLRQKLSLRSKIFCAQCVSVYYRVVRAIYVHMK